MNRMIHQATTTGVARVTLASVFVAGVLTTGVLAVANVFSDTQVESGTRSANAALVADTSASSGNAVKFGTGAPAAELMGWEVSPTNVGLAPHGLSCDTLPVYTGSDSPPAGTVISERRINTNLFLINGAITITKSCIRPTSSGPHGLISTWDPNNCPSGCATAKGQVTITDSEIDGSLVSTQQIAYTGAFMGVGILERNYFHDIGSGIAFYNTGSTYTASAINNYVHRLRGYGNPATTGSHNEAATVRDHQPGAGNRTLTFRGNFLTSDSGNDTGALFLQPYGGFINNVTIENNLVAGGGYQLILEGNHSGYGNNMRSINNRFSGTGFGPGYTDGGPGWALWTGNYRNAPGQPDNKGAVVNM